MNLLPPPVPPAIPTPRTSALAVWSLIIGLLGMLFCLPALAGLVCAVIALIRINQANGSLRGNRLALSGLIVSSTAPIFLAVAASIVLPLVSRTKSLHERSSGQTLAEARLGFTTRLTRNVRTEMPVPEPPAGELARVSYHSPIGDLAAYLSPIPDDGRLHPAIVWLFGGFSNRVGEAASEPRSAETDQLTTALR